VTKNALAGLSLYSATKGAQEAFNRALAAEVAPRGITANAVSPGYVSPISLFLFWNLHSDPQRHTR
jgi:NAD(P)-dependent dehydrogenase (short-subunit alcohol dehydrogenase family)